MQSQTASYVLSTRLSPQRRALLTTLDHAKDELSITDSSQDERLERQIRQVSAAIGRYCNRDFGLALWQDQFRPHRGIRGEGVRAANNPLQVVRWPLAAGPVAITGNTHSNLLVDGIASTAGLTQGLPIAGPGIPDGTTIAAVQPNSLRLSQLATATASAVALSAGLVVTEWTPGQGLQLLVPGTQYEADLETAQVYRLHEQRHTPRTWPETKIIMTYLAGYVLPGEHRERGCGPRLPEDLEDAALRLLTMRYHARGRDPLLVERAQPNLGSTRWWIPTGSAASSALPPEVAVLVDNYRVPVVA